MREADQMASPMVKGYMTEADQVVSPMFKG